MLKISTRSTKTEILEAYNELQSQRMTWSEAAALVASTAHTVSVETAALARDCYRLGVLSRQWISQVVDELSQPVIRSKA
jgi:hypothetical protein